MEHTERFVSLVAGGAQDVALDEAMALVAAHARPDLDVAAQFLRLDTLAESCPASDAASVLDHLFGPGRFTGNSSDYYDPRNSLLDHVLERRLGIPISLAVVAIEVARRRGVSLAGVGMPGHFLVLDEASGRFADPFSGPSLVSAAECRLIYTRLGVRAPWDDSHLSPVSNLAIVIRVLTNLKATYLQRNDLGGLRWVMGLRAAIPGLGAEEHDEFRRLMARLN